MRLLFVFSLLQAVLSSAISDPKPRNYDYRDADDERGEDDFGLWQVQFEHSSEDKGYYWESARSTYYNPIEEHWDKPITCHYYCTPGEACSGRQWCNDKIFEYFWDGEYISLTQIVVWGQDRACIAGFATIDLEQLDDKTGILTGIANVTVKEVTIL